MFHKSLSDFLYSFVIVAITALFCSYFNHVGMENFYFSLNLSAANPPGYVFSFVWGILYILLILAFFLVINNKEYEQSRYAAQLFIANMFMQVLWTYAFFFNGWFLAGFIILLLMLLLTAYMMYVFHSVNKVAAWMLLPYLLWILFAAYLNWAVVYLNGFNYPIQTI